MLDFKTRAAQVAVEVLRDTGAERRIREDGYTRVDPLWIAAVQGVMVMRRPFEKLLGEFVRESTPGIMVNSDPVLDLSQLAAIWSHGDAARTHLLGLTANDQAGVDRQTSDRGDGSDEKWMLDEASELGLVTPVLACSLFELMHPPSP